MVRDISREGECARNRQHGDYPCRACRTCCDYYRDKESDALARVTELAKRREWTATIPGGLCRIICENGGLAITAIPECDGDFLIRRIDDSDQSGKGGTDA